MARPLELEKVKAFVKDYLDAENSGEELKIRYGVSSPSSLMKRAVRLGLLTQEEYTRAALARRVLSASRTNNSAPLLNDIELRNLARDYLLFDDTRDEIGKNYQFSPTSLTYFLNRAIDRGFMSRKERAAALRRRNSNRMKNSPLCKRTGKNHPLFGTSLTSDHRRKIRAHFQTEEGIRESRLSGIASSLKRRQNKYHVEGRFYADSLQEGATALVLEKIVPGYSVVEGRTFQVRNRGINNGGIDFLVDGEFLEWHPIREYDEKDSDVRAMYREIDEAAKTPEDRATYNEWRRGSKARSCR